jgi:hypothetical protein
LVARRAILCLPIIFSVIISGPTRVLGEMFPDSCGAELEVISTILTIGECIVEVKAGLESFAYLTLYDFVLAVCHGYGYVSSHRCRPV